MAKNDLLRPWEHAARAGQLRLRLVLALVVVAVATGVPSSRAPRCADARPTEAAFLRDALGAADAAAPLVRTPAPGVRVRIQPGGYNVAGPAGSVGLRAVQHGDAIVRHANGVSQTTDFGSAAVVVDDERTEQFLTVTRRQGEHTWRWQLDTSLVPRVGNDGAVVFLSDSSRRVGGPVLAPVQILDARGRNRHARGRPLVDRPQPQGLGAAALRSDSELPLPYVIDPAVTIAPRPSRTTAPPAPPTSPSRIPPAVAANDLLVADHRGPAGPP